MDVGDVAGTVISALFTSTEFCLVKKPESPWQNCGSFSSHDREETDAQDGEIAPWLKAFAVLTQDVCLVLVTHMVVYNLL